MKRYQVVGDGEGELKFSSWVATGIVSMLAACLFALGREWSAASMFLFNGGIVALNAFYPNSDARWIFWAKTLCSAES